jgi:hypothetical protein
MRQTTAAAVRLDEDKAVSSGATGLCIAILAVRGRRRSNFIATYLAETENHIPFINHDNYYSPCGSHDHGFWFPGPDGYITFQGIDCWASEEKCEKSSAHRRSIIEKFYWTWGPEIDARLTPEDCASCPYYKRSQPWAHLAYAHEFLAVYPEPGMLTGRAHSLLNKVTPFQLLQFVTEAGFRVVKYTRNYIKNSPPPQVLKLGISLDDLATMSLYVLAEVN